MTGMTASRSDRARKPCTKLLASTMSRDFKGVMNRRPSVPSRRSQLMQSAASSGTMNQTERKREPFNKPNKSPPSSGRKPDLKA